MEGILEFFGNLLLLIALLLSPDENKTMSAQVPQGAGMEVHYLDVGQADSALLVCDGEVLLIDGPFIQAEKSLEIAFRGSKNQRILDVPKSLAAGEALCVTSPRWLGEY